jgi:hypothetical protein
MTTLPVRAPLMLPIWWPRPAFTRIVSFAEAAVDTIVEANQLACAARARYPFAD